MEQIELVIKMPKQKYDSMSEMSLIELHSIIRSGQILPKGHGVLIDRSLLLEDMETAYRFANELVALGFAESFIEHAPTIIEADKEGAEECGN